MKEAGTPFRLAAELARLDLAADRPVGCQSTFTPPLKAFLLSSSSLSQSSEELATADLILASASPRRSDLLHQIGVHFVVAAEDIDERQRPAEQAVDYVGRLALEKAQAGYRRSETELPVLGAHTIVLCQGKIFGKPANADEAMAMLQALSGATHEVLSGVAIVNAHKSELVVSKTSVTFPRFKNKPLKNEKKSRYFPKIP